MTLTPEQMRVVDSLIHTSVDDARSTIQCARDTGPGIDAAVLEVAKTSADMLGHKTRSRIIQAEIRRQARRRTS